MSNNHVTAPTQRLCGHVGVFSFSTSKAARAEDARYATHTLCNECSAAVRAFAAPGKTGFHKTSLPKLVGTPSKVSYANSIRIKAIRALGPNMAELSKDKTLYGQLALAAYEMLFKIDFPGFWIQTREFEFDGWWLASEVESILRRTPCTAVKISSRSAYGYWWAVDRTVIRKASEALPDAGSRLADSIPKDHQPVDSAETALSA